MPELPEVEIVRRGLGPAIMDKHVKNIILNRSDLRGGIPANFKFIIEKNRIIATKRRGKYILVFTDSGAGFVLHLGMSGRIHIHRPEEDYHPAKHDHVVFTMDDHTRVVFNDPRRFGMLYLTHARTWEKEAPFDVMGPEPLAEDFKGKILAARLKNRRGPIKGALLDQKIVAGVGNIYACEALFESGIHPEKPAGEIQGAAAEKLARAIRSVLSKALKAGGSSLKDYKHTDGSLGYFQTQFSVYDRMGASCPGCDCNIAKTGGITRSIQSGRSSFYCPRKQK